MTAFTGTEFPLGVMKTVWNYIKGTIAQHCDGAQCHPVGYFKMLTTALWVELCAPQIHMLKSRLSVPPNVTSFGIRVIVK